MGNPLKGEVSFADGDDTYVLAYSVDSLCRLEDRLDIGVTDIAARLAAKPRLGFMRTIFWGGLQSRHPAVSEEAAGDILGRIGMVVASELVSDALVAAFPSTGEAASGDAGPPKSPAGTGRRSSKPGLN